MKSFKPLVFSPFVYNSHPYPPLSSLSHSTKYKKKIRHFHKHEQNPLNCKIALTLPSIPRSLFLSSSLALVRSLSISPSDAHHIIKRINTRKRNPQPGALYGFQPNPGNRATPPSPSSSRFQHHLESSPGTEPTPSRTPSLCSSGEFSHEPRLEPIPTKHVPQGLPTPTWNQSGERRPGSRGKLGLVWSTLTLPIPSSTSPGSRPTNRASERRVGWGAVRLFVRSIRPPVRRDEARRALPTFTDAASRHQCGTYFPTCSLTHSLAL